MGSFKSGSARPSTTIPMRRTTCGWRGRARDDRSHLDRRKANLDGQMERRQVLSNDRRLYMMRVPKPPNNYQPPRPPAKFDPYLAIALAYRGMQQTQEPDFATAFAR